MRTVARLSAIGFVVWGLGCRDDPGGVPTTPPEIGVTGSVLYLTVSDNAPRVGGTVTVTAYAATARSAKAVGSFAAHLRYDTHGLTFVAESRLPTGLRAFNPQPGHIRVAGAALEGFPDGRLFAVTFRVTEPRALTTMELALDELNGTDFGNRLPASPAERTVRLRVTPR
jgi:hypothetical protein